MEPPVHLPPTGLPQPGPPPGWYPDPSWPGYVRWFDGMTWTASVRPAGPPPGAFPSPYGMAPDPMADLAGVRAAGRWARRGVWVLAFFGPLLAAAYGLALHQFVSVVRTSIHQSQQAATNGNQALAPFPAGSFGWIGSVDLIGFVALAASVALMVWMYQSANIGKRMGTPTTLHPVWAILGWLIPIVQFWFPYKVIAGSLPLGDPARRLALRWWLLYILGNYGFLIVGIILAFAPTPVMVILIPTLAYSWYEARQGEAMIEGVDTAQARMCAALGYSVPARDA